MIQEAGGVVEFDLPPPDLGKETGPLSPRIDWYVTDERDPTRDDLRNQSDASVAQETKLKQRVGEVIKEARLNGIRPMTIGKLLAFLGYDMNTSVVGRTEAVNTNAMRRLTAIAAGPRVSPPKRPFQAAAKSDADDEMKKTNRPRQMTGEGQGGSEGAPRRRRRPRG